MDCHVMTQLHTRRHLQAWFDSCLGNSSGSLDTMPSPVILLTSDPGLASDSGSSGGGTSGMWAADALGIRRTSKGVRRRNRCGRSVEMGGLAVVLLHVCQNCRLNGQFIFCHFFGQQLLFYLSISLLFLKFLGKQNVKMPIFGYFAKSISIVISYKLFPPFPEQAYHKYIYFKGAKFFFTTQTKVVATYHINISYHHSLN
jgi:hypothetical protein